MTRLDQERQNKLEPVRVESCKKQLEKMGFVVKQLGQTQLQFIFNGSTISFWPYSGWFSGKTVRDNRGFKNLLNQITGKK